MWAVKIDSTIGINFLIHSAIYSHKWAYLYLVDNTIAHWSMPVLRNLQTRGAIIAAFTNKKQ